MPALPSPLVRLTASIRRRHGKGGTALLAVMLLAFISAVGFAIEAEKPWGRTVQKRLAKNEALQPKEHAIIGLWWAAAINAGILGTLLLTANRWMPPASETKPETETVKPPFWVPSRRLTLALVLGAVAWGAWERWPKMTQSFWNDEEYATRRFVHGDWERQPDGSLVFGKVAWTDTLFENRNGNNHLLNSLLARTSLAAWRSLTGAPREAFTEFVPRLPQFVLGLATIALVFLLGKELGSPLAGLGASWLLAVHPWHIRYSAEMRGYALMLFFVALAMLGLCRALKTGRLRWWLVFALSQPLFLLSFAGTLHVAVAVNAVAFINLVLRRNWPDTRRLVAFNLLGAVPVIQWMLPSIPQMLAWMREVQPAYVTSVTGWLRDFASTLAIGWQFDNPFPEAHVGTDWKEVSASFPGPPWLVAVVLAGLALGGVLLALRRGTAGWLIVFSPVLAAAVTMALNLRPGSPMTVWYLIFLLVPLPLAIGLLLERAGQWRNLRWLPAVLITWFVLRYSMAVDPAVAAVRNHDRQPVRQTVAFVHERAPHGITATFGVSDRQCKTYDAGVYVLEEAKDLDDCIALSRTTGVPLHVYYCSDDLGSKRRPDIYQRVVKSGEFERVAEFPGSEELFSYRVYQLKARP